MEVKFDLDYKLFIVMFEIRPSLSPRYDENFLNLLHSDLVRIPLENEKQLYISQSAILLQVTLNCTKPIFILQGLKFQSLNQLHSYKKRLNSEKVTNIEYGNVDFENDIIEFLTSTPI